MLQLLERKTLTIMSSAFLLALACVLQIFPFWIMYPLWGMLNVASTLFHELGHSIFMWLFGIPNVPAILLIGSDQASGVTMSLGGRHPMFQVTAILGLSYACYWVYENHKAFLYYIISFSLIILLAGFTSYYEPIISYMGHGSEILVGGFLLFKGWVYMARNTLERWINGFFGFSLTLRVINFSYNLVFDSQYRAKYSNSVVFGSSHNDFMSITQDIPSWTVEGIAIFTIFFAISMIMLAFSLAFYVVEELAYRTASVSMTSIPTLVNIQKEAGKSPPRILDKEW